MLVEPVGRAHSRDYPSRPYFGSFESFFFYVFRIILNSLRIVPNELDQQVWPTGLTSCLDQKVNNQWTVFLLKLFNFSTRLLKLFEYIFLYYVAGGRSKSYIWVRLYIFISFWHKGGVHIFLYIFCNSLYKSFWKGWSFKAKHPYYFFYIVFFIYSFLYIFFYIVFLCMVFYI